MHWDGRMTEQNYVFALREDSGVTNVTYNMICYIHCSVHKTCTKHAQNIKLSKSVGQFSYVVRHRQEYNLQ